MNNNRMKELRAKRGWTQTTLTLKTGLTQSILSQIENGKREPNPSWKKRIAKAFKLRVEDVFDEEKRKERKE